MSAFRQNYKIVLGERTSTVNQLYKHLQLKSLDCSRDDVQLCLAVDKAGQSKGRAFLSVPLSQKDLVMKWDGSVLAGKKIRIIPEKFSSRKNSERCIQHGKGRAIRALGSTLAPSLRDTPLVGVTEGPLFDAGANLVHPKFKPDVDEVIKDAAAHGVKKINIYGESLQITKYEVLPLVNTYKGIFDLTFSAGQDPSHCYAWQPCWSRDLEKLCQEPSCSSIGMIGLDYTAKYQSMQRRAFIAQLEVACTVQKPLILVEVEAYDDFLNIIERYRWRLPPTAIYCPTTDQVPHIQKYINLGFYLILTGVTGTTSFTFSKGVREALTDRVIDVTRIIVASNAPIGITKRSEVKTIKLNCMESQLAMVSPGWCDRPRPSCVFLIQDMVSWTRHFGPGNVVIREWIYKNSVNFFKGNLRRPGYYITLNEHFQRIARPFSTFIGSNMWLQIALLVLSVLVIDYAMIYLKI